MFICDHLKSPEALQTIIDVISSPIFLKDREHRLVLINDAMANLMGRSRHDLLGKTDFELVPRAQAQIFQDMDDAVFVSGRPNENEELVTDSAATVRRIITRKQLVTIGDGPNGTFLMGVISDITAIRESEARVRHLAYHDPLTGLANRTQLREQLNSNLKFARSTNGQLALLAIDLDRFKAVNDGLGHGAGDEVLRTVAVRLRQSVRGGDTIARLGGDEFVIVMPNIKARAEAEALAARVVDTLADDYPISDQCIASVSASVGVAIFPGDGDRSDTLFANADFALYRAKQDGSNGFAFFHPDMDASTRSRRTLENDVRRALERGELSLVYQPQADGVTGRIVGFEALLRWHHAERGEVSPSEFIPIAEQCGAIVSIGAWVLREACAEAARWPVPLRVAVNASAVQIQQSDFGQQVAAALAQSGLKPDRLEIEVTESLLIRDADRAYGTLHDLRLLGVRVALDDFGTGYSSLAMLSTFTFDRVKVDRSFVRDLPDNHEAAAIVRAVLALGRSLRLPIIAEGVETEAQLELLRQEGCTEVQGYLIGRPQPITAHRGLTHRVDLGTARPGDGGTVVPAAPDSGFPKRRRRAAAAGRCDARQVFGAPPATACS